MRPVQGVPEMSPFYVEFEEYLGGYNFGGGNAQLDFRDMACSESLEAAIRAVPARRDC